MIEKTENYIPIICSSDIYHGEHESVVDLLTDDDTQFAFARDTANPSGLSLFIYECGAWKPESVEIIPPIGSANYPLAGLEDIKGFFIEERSGNYLDISVEFMFRPEPKRTRFLLNSITHVGEKIKGVTLPCPVGETKTTTLPCPVGETKTTTLTAKGEPE